MAFKLGNFSVKEIMYGVTQDFNDNMLYVLDQLTNASIEVSSDPTEITDKRGNIIRTIYNSKTATFTAQSALVSPVLMNAQSGSDAEIATNARAIEMPKIVVVGAGSEVDVPDAKDGTIHVIGLYNNGANGVALTQSTTAVVDTSFAYDSVTKKVTVPGTATDAPDQYLIKYDRDVTSGMKISNKADAFPDTVKMTLYAAVMDPCSDKFKAAYIVIPSLTPDPSVTISFDSENQEVDFSGSVNINYCSCDKDLFYIFFPDEDAVITVACN